MYLPCARRMHEPKRNKGSLLPLQIITMNPPETSQLATVPDAALAVSRSEPTAISILQAAVQKGITPENVSVVKEIIAMRREEVAHEAKIAFNRAFFALKREIAGMEFYADKTALTKSGATAYTYCSEAELNSKLEPVLFKHGFAMMFGQQTDGERVVAEVTLIHEGGHEEKREYAVRTGAVNAMKDVTAVDTGSTTSAWRHLIIKMFGLKSRIKETADAANDGEFISFDKVQYLRERCKETGMSEATLLRLAGAESLEKVGVNIYPVLTNALSMKKPANAQ